LPPLPPLPPAPAEPPPLPAVAPPFVPPLPAAPGELPLELPQPTSGPQAAAIRTMIRDAAINLAMLDPPGLDPEY
jgi:hypothetical protein